jgi:hypothetical protein
VDFPMQSPNRSQDVTRILALEGACGSEAARAELRKWKARELFPEARSPEGAMAGLYVHFSCFGDAHGIARDLNTKEGSFWHGILHRQEPDAGNAAYWFRQVGKHPVFPALAREARLAGYKAGAEWDPFVYIDYCERARLRSGSEEERLANRVRQIEWQLLFGYCAGRRETVR